MKVYLTTWLIFLILGAVSADRRDDEDDYAGDNGYDPLEPEFEVRRSRSRGRGAGKRTVIVPDDSTVIIVPPNYPRRYEDDYDSANTRDYDYRDRRRINYEDRRISDRGRATAPRKDLPNKNFEREDRKQRNRESASPPLNTKKAPKGSSAKKSSGKAKVGGALDVLKIGG